MRMRAVRRPAFTLVEVILAMAVMLLLAGSLYAAMHAGFRARARAETLLAPFDAASAALDAMDRDFQCAPPPRGILAGVFVGTDGQDAASGEDADSVAFYTRPPASVDAAPGIVRVEYALRPADAGNDAALVRYVTVNLLAPEVVEPAEEVLCPKAVSLNFRYYDGADWLDSWDSTTAGDSLPLAVEAVVGVAAAENAADAGDSSIRRFARVTILPCRQAPSAGITVGGGR